MLRYKRLSQACCLILLCLSLLFTVPNTTVWATTTEKQHAADAGDNKTYSSWLDVAKEMEIYLDNAEKAFNEGNYKEAYDFVNQAYFGHYEVSGFERVTMDYISGKHGRQVEGQIYLVRKLVSEPGDKAEINKEIVKLKEFLFRDANTLDGTSQQNETEDKQNSVPVDQALGKNKTYSFTNSFALLLREGLEAILVIVAILAYLSKTGKKKEMRGVYYGALGGIVFSIVLAFALNFFTDYFGLTSVGQSREIFEGAAMFLAVIVLYWVSNWMINKSEVEEWNNYIHGLVDDSLTTGSRVALIFSSFLAVAREGAELILFYQALLSNQQTDMLYMWLGILAGVVVLAIVYVLIRVYSIKLPLKPFFYATSILMFILCISFLGKGVAEFQEADLIGRHYILGDTYDSFSVELLGIYDRYETLIPQVILLLITLGIFIRHLGKKKHKQKVETP